MTPAGILERAERIVAARRPLVCDRDLLAAALVATEQSIAWFEAQRAGLITQLASIESFPEATIAETARCSLGNAGKTKERADTLADTPALAAALEDGAITAGHVDAVTRGSKKLEPSQRDEFMDRVEHLVGVAAAGTIEEFSRRLGREIKKIQADDGMARLARQKRATRLSSWVDGDGMWNLRGRFDPQTALGLAGKIERVTDALFAQVVPEHCPSDPVEKNKFLNAHALAALIKGAGTESDSDSESGSGSGSGFESRFGSSGRPEYVVVIDASNSDGAGGPMVEWPIPVEIPLRVLADMIGDADVHTIVVRNGVVLHAPGRTDLGRTTRLANRAQRRALRGLYRRCAIPGCTVGYDRCKLHHVIWWRHGGRTDLDNLLPVCSKHHAKIHNDGWIVELAPDRSLTLTLPDGRVMNTGPPGRAAA